MKVSKHYSTFMYSMYSKYPLKQLFLFRPIISPRERQIVAKRRKERMECVTRKAAEKRPMSL